MITIAITIAIINHSYSYSETRRCLAEGDIFRNSQFSLSVGMCLKRSTFTDPRSHSFRSVQVRSYDDRASCWNVDIPYKRAYALSSYALSYVALTVQRSRGPKLADVALSALWDLRRGRFRRGGFKQHVIASCVRVTTVLFAMLDSATSSILQTPPMKQPPTQVPNNRGTPWHCDLCSSSCSFWLCSPDPRGHSRGRANHNNNNNHNNKVIVIIIIVFPHENACADRQCKLTCTLVSLRVDRLILYCARLTCARMPCAHACTACTACTACAALSFDTRRVALAHRGALGRETSWRHPMAQGA